MKKLIPTTAFLVLAVLAACATNPVTTTIQPSQDAKKTQVLGILEVELSSRAGDVSSANFIEAGNSGLRAQGVAVPINATNWVFTPGVTVFDDSNGYDKFFRNTISFENKTGTSFQNLAMYALTTPSSVGGTGFTAIKTLAGTLLTGTAASDVARAVMPTHGMTNPTTVDPDKADLMLYSPAEAATVQAQLIAPNFSIANPTVLEYGFLGRNKSTGARAIGTNSGACVGASNPACSKGTITWAFRFPLDVPNSSNLGKFTLRYVVVNEPGLFAVESIEDQNVGTVAGGSSASTVGELRILARSAQWYSDDMNPLCRVRTAISPNAFLGPDPLPSDPGSLDVCFGATGLRGTFGQGKAVALQPDGKLIVLNESGFSLTRYNKNGSLDSSFGTNGTVTTPGDTFGTAQGTGYYVDAKSVAVRPDGKIIVGGDGNYTLNSSSHNVFPMARYMSNGSLDPTFGTNGVIVNGGFLFSLLNNGQIIVVQTEQYGSGILLGRLNSDGSEDGSFSSPTLHYDDSYDAKAITVQTDGKIVVVGSKYGSGLDFMVARWNPNGTLDSNFGTAGNGVVVTPVGAGNRNDEARAVAIQNDGKIVLVGGSTFLTYQPFYSSFSDFALARYNSDGTLDSSFAGGAFILTVDANSQRVDNARAVRVQNNGKIVVAGFAGDYNSNQALLYLNSNGVLLDTFRTSISTNTSTGANAMAVQSDGKLVVVGPGLIVRFNP
jgi:uncharacterized delta-60 repeat protein